MGKGGLEKQARKGEKEILAGNSKTLVFYKRMISGKINNYSLIKWLPLQGPQIFLLENFV